MTSHPISFSINGYQESRAVPANLTLLKFLRDQLCVTGTKSGCDTGECGACTVLMNGEPINACMVLAVEIDGCDITTVEGFAGDDGLDPLQRTFIENTGTQCGFCTPGILISARSLLERNPDPTESEIQSALRGNLCRCTGYVRIVQAIQTAAREGG